MKPSVVIANY